MKLYRVWILTAAFLMLFSVNSFANGGPTSKGAELNGVVQFDQNSNVKLESEFVTFNCTGSSAEVEVIYYLKNTTDSPKEINMKFVASYYKDSTDFKVSVNGGSTANYNISQMKSVPLNWFLFNDNMIDPISKKQIKMREYSYQNTGEVDIPLSFGPGDILEIKMKYKDPGGFLSGNYINNVHTHMYYMTPAEFWEGSPKVHLKLQVPQNIKIGSNIALNENGKGIYEKDLNGIPHKEWLITYASGKGLLFGTNEINKNNMYTAIVASVLAVLFFIIGIIFRNKKLVLFPYILIWFFIIFSVKKFFGIYLDTIALPVIYLLSLLILFIAYMIAKSIIKKRI